MTYSAFFSALTGNAPYPYQERLAGEPWPGLLDIPTGLGKTSAVMLAWAWEWGMRLGGVLASAVSQALVLRNWAIGTYIVEFEQNGEDRAEYGDGLLRRLSSDLGACGIKGVSPDMLERMRLFSRHYPQLADSISAPAVRKS